MSLDSFYLLHLSNVRRRLAEFLCASQRRCLVAERDAKVWHWYHEVEESVIYTDGARKR